MIDFVTPFVTPFAPVVGFALGWFWARRERERRGEKKSPIATPPPPSCLHERVTFDTVSWSDTPTVTPKGYCLNCGGYFEYLIQMQVVDKDGDDYTKIMTRAGKRLTAMGWMYDKNDDIWIRPPDPR